MSVVDIIVHNAKVTMEGVTILTIVNYMLMPLTIVPFPATSDRKSRAAGNGPE